ncbi:MAG: sigma-54-dependent Fis family transcriptional regulator, partial [Nitrospirae bacterium]|nr:sigma-54-dependent Fis family transcriptional regulator [Nitrospirota bacterium]
MRGNILVVDDERSQREILRAILREEGYEVAAASGGAEALRMAEEAAFDLVLTDLKMPDLDGLGLLTRLQAAHPTLRVIIMTAHGTIDSAVEAMRRGAFHYLTKPLERDALVLLVERAFEQIRLVRENLLLQEELQERFRIENLVGRHKSMQEVFRMIRMVAPTASTVLIRGESGTGKELVARAIHYNSPRKDKPFRAINCAAIPETLLESELFGYEKGAFTGATTRGIGLFEAAHGGTLFLDEIGDMALPLQSKILRVLQEMEIRRIGGKADIPVDVRILAASNKDLEEEMRQGRFRKDLYYRLNVISFALPPLRERASDIPELAAHFVEKHAQAVGKPIKSISPEALRV